MRLVQMPKSKYYWSNSQRYGSKIIRNAMSRKKFELLLKFWQFSNNNNKNSNQDRLFKLKPLLYWLKARFSSVYVPGSTITVDETMVPWRGRFLFEQYIPWKRHEYGVKMYKLAATNGYTWNYIIYSGEQGLTADIGHAEAIVMNLLDDLDGCYSNCSIFTSISLTKHLLEHDTYLIGTLRTNRVRSGSKVLQNNLRLGEAYEPQNKGGVKLIKWKDKRDILMVSTKPPHSATVVDTGNINSKNERIMKSQVVLDYNKGRQGIDLSDQLSAYYTCVRRSIKWYRKAIFELVFRTAIVTSYLLYKENYVTNKVTIL